MFLSGMYVFDVNLISIVRDMMRKKASTNQTMSWWLASIEEDVIVLFVTGRTWIDQDYFSLGAI